MQPSRSPVIALQFAGAGIAWGASFLFMKVALTGTSFGQIAWIRLLLGALALGAIVAVTRSRIPRSPLLWLHFAVVGLTGSFLPFLLFAWAEQHVPSGLASIYNAVTPIATAILSTLAFRVERLRRLQVAGVALGIVGVLVIIGPWQGFGTGDAALAGQLACIGAATLYGVTFGYLRRFVTPYGLGGVVTAFLQIGMGAIIALIATPWLAAGPFELNPAIVLSLLTLGVVGTGVAYLWNVNVLLSWGPTATSTVTYVTPVVGVALGVLVLGERLAPNQPAGAALVLAGILLAQGRVASLFRGLRRRETPETEAPPAHTPS